MSFFVLPPCRIVTALALLLGAEAAATEFAGNHLFISDPENNVIRELDPSGAVVRLLGGSTLVNPQRIGFGFDGNLYVLDDLGLISPTDHLVVISPDGDVLSNQALVGAGTFDAATAPAPCFTPRGTMLLVDTAQGSVLEVEIATATVLATYDDASIASAGGVRVTERGQLHVGVSNATHGVVVFEPNGFFVRALGSPSLGAGSAAPLLIDGNAGRQFLLLRSASSPATARLHALTATGTSIAQLDLVDGPYLDLSIGPDGALWLLAADGEQLVRVDPALATVTAVPFAPAPAAATGFAFAPYRLRLKMKGSVQFAGVDATSVPTSGYELAYYPGAERVLFQLEVGSPGAAIFGSAGFTLHGVKAHDDDATTRRIQSTFASEASEASVVASSFLRFTGSVNGTTQYFRPKGVGGTLLLAGVAGTFKAEIDSAKVLE